jgi:dipeptidyl aminopeptidase/acylaminoacyl peptidase
VNIRFRSILRRLEQDPGRILVLASLTHNDWADVATMDLKSGAMNVVARAPGANASYVLDHRDQVRLAAVTERQTRRVLYREANGQDWTVLTEHHVDAPGWEPLAFDGDNRTLFIASDVGRKTSAIYRYDTVTRQPLDLVAADDTYDLGSVIYDRAKRKIVGVYYEGDRRRFHWLDPELAALHAQIEKSLPGTVHMPQQFSADGTRIIFFSYSDRDPGVYYLAEPARKKFSELAVVKPGIDPDQMAPVKPITLTARDGLVLHGYLTLPKGSAGPHLPLILHPHGGPFGPRDEWRFDPEVQFYANRGFAVLQVNYRGSGGYGQQFEAAGYRKWGLEMQDDLTDAVNWAIAEGIADPARVVISGASYGGYAVMAGLAFTPELYCAGINYVGATDIDLLVPKAMPADRMYWMRTRIGDPADAADRKRLHDTSPVHFADRIRAPVLMAYGKNDPRVTIEHGYDMERALKKAGKEYEMILERDEGHGFRKEEKSIAFFTRVDAFLKKHVLLPGGKVEVGATQVIAMPAGTPK